VRVRARVTEAEQEFQKALKYLDLGKMEQSEQCLERAITAAKITGDNAAFIRVAVCYGDLLSETGRLELAVEWLKSALDRASSMSLDTDLLDFEISRAQEILARLEGE